MHLERPIIWTETFARRFLPPGLVVAANARLHRLIGERELRMLDQLVTPGTCAVDVGAHFGTYMHRLAGLVGAKGTVISIEPIAEDARFLERAARQLRLPVTVHACAVSSHGGTAELHVPILHGQEKAAIASLESHQSGTRARTVPVRTLDELLADEPLPVSFIKIDVEGHEMAVIEGARDVIARHRPNLLIEIEQRFHKTPLADVIEQILALGYEGTFLDATGNAQPVSAFDPAKDQDPAMNPLDKRFIANFIFRPV